MMGGAPCRGPRTHAGGAHQPLLMGPVSQITNLGCPGMGRGGGTATLSWGACAARQQEASEQGSPGSNVVIRSAAATT